MTDAYTYVAKPTGTPYTNINVAGKQQYDEPLLTFDDSATFYDGVNQSAYTLVAKPANAITVTSAGMATGLLIPLTRGNGTSVLSDPYTYVSKPTL